MNLYAARLGYWLAAFCRRSASDDSLIANRDVLPFSGCAACSPVPHAGCVATSPAA
ncbi:Uncharacterised protein [Mycobacterium tuberculosis]|nr:Uncharacterised protein [Mycobacterium tuberculosis]COY37356.1 Uncharacterised protein [Mycobacterium tuberculosis]